jgi:hypothetical protein
MATVVVSPTRKKSMPIKPNQNLRDVDRALIQAVMFELGILPMESTHLDMRRALQQLPPEEARTLKRKFRKVWRKTMKNVVNLDVNKKPTTRSADAVKRVKQTLGVGKHVPSRHERQARKQLVFDALWTDVIAPRIAQFENAGQAPKAEKVRKKSKKTK